MSSTASSHDAPPPHPTATATTEENLLLFEATTTPLPLTRPSTPTPPPAPASDPEATKPSSAHRRTTLPPFVPTTTSHPTHDVWPLIKQSQHPHYTFQTLADYRSFTSTSTSYILTTVKTITIIAWAIPPAFTNAIADDVSQIALMPSLERFVFAGATESARPELVVSDKNAGEALTRLGGRFERAGTDYTAYVVNLQDFLLGSLKPVVQSRELRGRAGVFEYRTDWNGVYTGRYWMRRGEAEKEVRVLDGRFRGEVEELVEEVGRRERRMGREARMSRGERIWRGLPVE